ncbi:MAG: putative RNA methyltransferase [Faecousia sp.]
MELLCPLCGKPLAAGEKSLVCGSGHRFDIARQGYVHLLPVQRKHSLHPGDTREQVAARRAFLDSGFYAPIAEAVCQAAKDCTGPVIDVGCGEGYYGAKVAEHIHGELLGVDISKEAVRFAAARYKSARWVCGTAASLPVPDHSAGLLLSMFAVTLPEEFRRVLRPDGRFLQVLAAEDHLLGLKEIIYPQLTHKEKNTVPALPGFTLERSIPLRFPISLEGQQVQNLLYMTPHVYRIGAEGARRLRETERLRDTASVVINLYRPDSSLLSPEKLV